MKIKHWLSNHPTTSVSVLVISTVLLTLAVCSPQVGSADPPTPTVAGPSTGKTRESPLIGQSMYVYTGTPQGQFQFIVLDVDPRTGMICLQDLPTEKPAEPPVPFWLPASSIRIMFGGKGFTRSELDVLTKKFNESSPFGSVPE